MGTGIFTPNLEHEIPVLLKAIART